jgi:hypothetical protein
VTLAQAKAALLMGRPESWSGHGRRPLGDVPDPMLRQARAFFLRCLTEGKNPRMEEQVDAINMVLADNEAHSPQQSLAL